MGVDGGITSRAGQVLPLNVSNVAAVPGILVLFRETKIDDVADVPLGTGSDQEVVGFHVTVDVRPGVHELKSATDLTQG